MTQINNESELYNIHNLCIDTKSRELYLHSSFDSEEESGVEFRSAIMFEKNVRYLNQISHDPILVHMHLPGGDWQDCMGIVDTIATSHSKIFILAYGKVESASSILLQAADLRVLMPNTHMLIHYGSLSIEDEHRAAKSSFEWSEKESLKMINMFSERCIDSPIAKERNWKKHIIKKHIMSQLDNKSDWILNADESVYYGFADGVLGDRKFTTIEKLKSRKR
jgi:ATP-dependent protease ClpP protease subunit|tara:strand:+ start:755 stop:1420 length:666 start_codon:yes stop_codon:yes gene_type:complete